MTAGGFVENAMPKNASVVVWVMEPLPSPPSAGKKVGRENETLGF